MRFPKVLLVTPYAPRRFFGGVRPPVGMGYIEEFITAGGIEVEAIDMNVGRHPWGRFQSLVALTKRFEPTLVGFTVWTYQHLHVYRMIRRFRALFPHVSIIVGGAHVSAVEDQVMRECQAIDFAASGEGERLMLRLCEGVPYTQIPGLFYRQGGQIRSGGPREWLMDLDLLPFPRFESYQLDAYTSELEINTSRGCPFKCIFCSVPNIMGKKVRYRSIENVINELRHFYEQGVRNFQFGDDNFLVNRRRVTRLFEAIEAANFEGLTLRCGQGVRADLINRELLELMYRVGFRHLGIGVESAVDEVLEMVIKGTNAATIERGVSLAVELGFDVSLLFVIGTPGETLAHVKRSIEFAERYPVMKAHFFSLVPFPGTPLYDWVIENDALLGEYSELINQATELKLRTPPFFETAEMPAADRYHAQRLTEAASKRIQVRTLQRKMAHLGPIGTLLSQAGRSDFLERNFIRNRRLRQITDRVVFRGLRAVQAQRS